METIRWKRKRSLTAQRVMLILGDHGQELSMEQAQQVTEMIYELANLSVNLELALAVEKIENGRNKIKVLNHPKKS